MALPALFARLTVEDWARVRAAASQLEAGDEEAVALSVGYVDVGKSDRGAAFVGGMSMDSRGGGGLSYRTAYQMSWPREAKSEAKASARLTAAGIEFRARRSGSVLVLVPVREADWWRLSSFQETTEAKRRRDALLGRVLAEASAASGASSVEVRSS